MTRHAIPCLEMYLREMNTNDQPHTHINWYLHGSFIPNGTHVHTQKVLETTHVVFNWRMNE